MRLERRCQELGFTLIELMIVIAVIAVIAAIAIPSLLESRKSSNESSAIQALRAIHSAQTLFRDRDMDRDGIANYSDGGNSLVQAGLISRNVLSDGGAGYNGYHFGILGTLESWDVRHEFGAIAVPVSQGKSGDRTYFIDDSGVIRFAILPSGVVEVPSQAVLQNWPAIGG